MYTQVIQMKKSISRLFRPVVLAMAVASIWAPPTWAGGPDVLSVATGDQSTDQLIIKYRAGSAAHGNPSLNNMARAHEAINRAGVQMQYARRNTFDAHIMKLDRRVAVDRLEAIAAQMKADDADIEYIEPDRIQQIMLTPNDPSYLDQWHYYEATAGINAPAAWDQSTGTGVVVAVIDTGYRPHADLVGNLVAGYDFVSNITTANDGDGRDNDPADPGDWVIAGECATGSVARNSSWHGTHVAGTIAALTNNAAGVAGVAFAAKIQPVRVLGKCGGYTSDIADGIVWASGGAVSGAPVNATPARVLNMSLGGAGSCSTTTQNAINGARARGAVVVVAAGNSTADASGFNPANCAGVVTVAALDRNAALSYYSNFGAVVDVAAPGGDKRAALTNAILSTLNSGTTTPGADSYAYYQGTSMATPHVAATAALILAKNPSLEPTQVETILKTTARPFPATCAQCGSGIVDANAAVTTAATTAGTGGGTLINEGTGNNNTLAAAQVVSVNPAIINGSLNSSDTDYYRVTLNAGKTLTATLTPPLGVNYNLYVYNSAGSLLTSSTLGAGLVDQATSTNSGGTAVNYYVRVVYSAGGTGNYVLRLAQ
jgi:serine protease